jgi:hypothetical protein
MAMSYRNGVSLGRIGVREIYAAMTKRERLLFWLAIVNFFTFVAIAMCLGGDALNGTARDGHYYLMQHGVYTEVSRPVFLYSALHALSVIITTLLAVVVQFRARFRARNEAG